MKSTTNDAVKGMHEILAMF